MPKWNSNYYNQTINGGISAELAKNHTIGASLSYSKETDKWGGHSASQMFHDNLLFEDLSSNIHSHANYDQWMGNIFYDGKFSQKWKMPRLLSTTRQIYINNVRGVFARVVIDAVGPVCQFDYRVNKQVQYEE